MYRNKIRGVCSIRQVSLGSQGAKTHLYLLINRSRSTPSTHKTHKAKGINNPNLGLATENRHTNYIKLFIKSLLQRRYTDGMGRRGFPLTDQIRQDSVSSGHDIYVVRTIKTWQ
jgi:hypothetical protein